MKEGAYGCRVGAAFVSINVVREHEMRGGKERKRERNEVVMAIKAIIGTRRSYSFCVEL